MLIQGGFSKIMKIQMITYQDFLHYHAIYMGILLYVGDKYDWGYSEI